MHLFKLINIIILLEDDFWNYKHLLWMMHFKGGFQETEIKTCAYMTMGWWIITSVCIKPCWHWNYRTTSQITGFRKFFHDSVPVLIFVIIVLLSRSCSFWEFFLWPIWYVECPYYSPPSHQLPIQLLLQRSLTF